MSTGCSRFAKAVCWKVVHEQDVKPGTISSTRIDASRGSVFAIPSLAEYFNDSGYIPWCCGGCGD